MTDSSPWAAPSGPEKPAGAPSPFTPAAPAPPAPGSMPPPAQPGTALPPPNAVPPNLPPPNAAPPNAAPPNYLPPNPYAQPVPVGQQAPGWTPPPKPGLIPLRPLTLGPLLGASFQVMRRNPRPTFGFALLLSGLTSIVSALIAVGVFLVLFNRVSLSAPGEDSQTIAAGAFAGSILALLIPIGLSVVGFAILQGIISLEVARATLGEKLKLGGLWRGAKGRIGALVGWSMLLLAAAVVVVAVFAAIIAGAAAAGGSAGAAVAVLVTVLLSFGVAVLAIWVGIKTALVPSILMTERLPLRAAIVRSWRLTNGFFWRTFGILLLVGVIVNFASSIVSTPIQFLALIPTTLINPLNDMETYLITTALIGGLVIIVSLVVSAIGLVVLSSATTLVYLDLRMRKEGLDLELARFVETRQAGNHDVPDPYLPRATEPAMPGFVQPAAAQSTAPSTSPWS